MLKVVLRARYLATVAGLVCVSVAQAQVGADVVQAQQPALQQGDGPLQNIAPVEWPTDVGNLEPRPAGQPPLMPASEIEAGLPPSTVAPGTDPGTMNQLIAQVLSGPDGTNPAVLANIINMLASQQPSSSKATSSLPPSTLPPPLTPPVFTPVTAPLPPTPPTPSAPGPLPPVFNVPPQAQASPR